MSERAVITYIVILVLFIVSQLCGQVNPSLTKDNFKPGSEILSFKKGWKYHLGDNREWASPNYNDSSWAEGDPYKTPGSPDKTMWNGIGWFRFKFNVDSLLFNKIIGLRVWQGGASEIYLNGVLIKTVGKVGTSSRKEIAKWGLDYPLPVVLGDKKEHVLAVRFSNFLNESLRKAEYQIGFNISIGNIDNLIEMRVEQERKPLINLMLFGMIPLILSIIHLFVFFFYRKDISNLYFGIISLAIGAFSFIQYKLALVNDPNITLFLGLSLLFFIVIVIIFLILFTYENFNKSVPKHFIAFVLLGAALNGMVFIDRSYEVYKYLSFFGIFAAIEILRVIGLSLYKRNVVFNFLIIGFLIFIGSMIADIINEFGIIDFSISVPYTLPGILVWFVFMSIHLSQKFGRVNRELVGEIARVKELSIQRIEAERMEKEREITRKLLEADNERKTKELDEARKLQESMLPNEIPQLPFLEIAASMNASTEVGGDYYDFYVPEKKSLILAIGDATGHGTKAGNMVSATKSLFSSIHDGISPISIIQTFDSAIKKMNLPNLYMALLIAKIDRDKFLFSNAGMPPIYLYKKASNQTLTLIQKSMPLGGPASYPYKEEAVELSKGDVILFSSDGFYEYFNQHGEILGVERAKEIFERHSACSVDDIITKIQNDLVVWSGGKQNSDDITLVAVRII